MKIVANEAYQKFLAAADAAGWRRIKDERDRTLKPGGRTELTLFEKTADDGRAHPRLRTSMPPAEDPAPVEGLFAVAAPPATAAAFEEALAAALAQAKAPLAGADLDDKNAPKGSERYWRNSIRAQRTARFFDEARRSLEVWIADGKLPASERPAATYALRAAEEAAYAGTLELDDSDTGTYHSFQHDAPFVHYLEAILKSLPEPGTPAFLLLPPEQQQAVRDQRDQARSHLDYLMRHKYAFDGIAETDIERTLGGLLIDRESRNVASETADSKDSLQPAYELLRIDPGAAHEHKGAWIYRDAEGGLHLQDGTPVQADAAQVRAAPLDPERLTFQRAPEDPRLRSGLRFDWDGNGYVQSGEIEWVSWAGHCDIKAMLEQTGITLADQPKLTEYRSDSDDIRTYDRDLLLEMIASIFELGSDYSRADGTGDIERGVHRFGGARDDSKPDRLQLQGPAPGKGFRWPMAGRQESFTVTAITFPEGAADMAKVFQRYLPDVEHLDFKDNPRFEATVEGDYNVINVSGAKLTVEMRCPEIDADTGYLREVPRTGEIDLGPGGEGQRFDLGTHVDDAAQRHIYRVYLDRKLNAIVAELDEYTRVDGKYQAKPVPDRTVTLPLAKPPRVTLSREMSLDDPAGFQTLLGVALRQAQNINADTEAQAPVWNGTVTRLAAQRLGADPAKRTERWQIDLRARFGSARLDYLLRRDANGEPEAFCPLPPDSYWEHNPDFLWQDFPDIGSKGLEGSDWVVNRTMVERGIVAIERDASAEGGFYVHDDHVKNVYEMLYCALGGLPFSVVHANKRYGFATEAEWKAAVEQLRELRAAVEYTDGRHTRPIGRAPLVN